MFNQSGLTPTDVLAINSRDDGFGGGNGSWLWIIIVFALLFGWGGNGFGGFGGGAGAQMNYVLSSDFATIQRQLSDGFNSIDNALDAQNTGICNLGYTQLQLNNQTNTNLLQSANALATQIADYCCKTQQNIKDVEYGIATSTGNIISAVKDCCCEERAQFADLKYNMATENCATRQAIADSTRQIIDYMSNKEMQNLRDENQALRLSASQSCQNQYLINALRPTPVPSFNVGYNPYGYGYGFGFGTTIA